MAPQKSELDAEIQRLYSLPLGDFTKERNALAKRLKKAGREDDSETVEGSPKPTPSAWAVNMLFQKQRDRMDILLDAGRRARVAQGKAVAGAGAEALRDAIGAARILIEDLRRRAEAILAEDTGRNPSRAVSERLATNLQSLAFSPSAAEAAQRGWLDRDLEPPGFEVFAGLRIPQRVVDIATRRPPRPEPAPAPKPEKAPTPPAPRPEPIRAPTKAEREAARRGPEAPGGRRAGSGGAGGGETPGAAGPGRGKSGAGCGRSGLPPAQGRAGREDSGRGPAARGDGGGGGRACPGEGRAGGEGP